MYTDEYKQVKVSDSDFMPELQRVLRSLRNEVITFNELNQRAFRTANTLVPFGPQAGELPTDSTGKGPTSLIELLNIEINTLRNINQTYGIIVGHLESAIGTEV